MNPWQREVCNSLAFEATNPEKFETIASGAIDERLHYLVKRMKKVARYDPLVREHLRLGMGEEFLKKYPPMTDEPEETDLREEHAEAWFKAHLEMPTDMP